MTITRLKLIKYLAVFRKHIPGDTTHELHQTMDGIEEVKDINIVWNLFIILGYSSFSYVNY